MKEFIDCSYCEFPFWPGWSTFFDECPEAPWALCYGCGTVITSCPCGRSCTKNLRVKGRQISA